MRPHSAGAWEQSHGVDHCRVKLDFPQEVHPQHKEEDNPDTQVKFPGQYFIGRIQGQQKFHTEGKYDKSQAPPSLH